MANAPQTPLTSEQLAGTLAPFTGGVQLTSDEVGKIQTYVDLLVAWNRTMSLTAIDDKREIAARHFGESIFGASAVPIRFGRLADVGSGAGFPGLPLKIVCQDLEVTLLEPNLKKCAFLTEVKRELRLEGVEVCRSRYEDYRPNAPFDFVCARALGNYKQLLRWAQSVLAPEGRVALWIGEEDSLLLSKTGEWSWDLPVRIPESARRVLQVGRPTRKGSGD